MQILEQDHPSCLCPHTSVQLDVVTVELWMSGSPPCASDVETELPLVQGGGPACMTEMWASLLHSTQRISGLQSLALCYVDERHL